jgi:hypothetical protein
MLFQELIVTLSAPSVDVLFAISDEALQTEWFLVSYPTYECEKSWKFLTSLVEKLNQRCSVWK